MKKFIALFLIFTIALSLPCMPSYAETTVDYTSDIEELSAIGIISKGYSSNELLTRGETAKYILKILNMEPVNETEVKYIDLPKDHTYFYEIMTVVKMGYMSGYSDNTIMPDAPIKRAELIKILIHLLNYKHLALENGNYPTGYMQTAINLGLLKGTGKTPYEEITKGESAKILNNALDIPLMYPVAISDSKEYTSDVNKTVLTEYLKLKRADGLVTANDTYSVQKDILAYDKKIRIDNVNYTPLSNMERTLVGYNVRYIYDISNPDEDVKDLIYVRELKNNILNINIDDYISISGNNITYKDSEDNNKTVKFSKDADIIYNSKKAVFDSSLFGKIKQGEIILMDTNDDNIYDVLKINEYYNIIANRIDEKDKTVSDIENITTVVSFDDSKKVFIYDKNRKPVDFSFINYTSVISIIENTDYIEAYIGGDAVTGKITEIATGKDGYVTVAGKNLKISPLISDISKSYLKIGSNVKLSLDMNGKVAYAKNYAGSDIRFMYLIKPYEQSEGPEKEPYIKAYDTEFGLTGFKIAKNITVNNVKVTSITLSDLENRIKKDDGNGNISYNQLISVRMNEKNEITHIQTVNELSNIDSENEDKFVKLADAKERRLITSTNYAYEVYFSETTPILIIPKNPENADISEFMTKYPTDYSKNGRVLVTMSAYSVNYNSGYADVLMIEGGVAGADVPENSPMCVLTRINDAVTENGDYAKKIYYYEEGEEKSALLTDDVKYIYNSVTYKASELQTGDAFRIETNDKGEVKGIVVIYKAATKTPTADQNGHETASNYRMVVSQVVKIHGDFITIHYSDTQADQKYIFDKQHFVIVEKNSNGDMTAKKGSVQDIELGDTLLIHAWAATVRTVIIYKP